ncbi:Fur family transcriptional regulator [Anaerorhabdus furcosa]|uniref:Fur family transcriptional regulator, peroxide stress response regulator n=1 Tax=Anaerorhabdus furcosa TaxID=118967 RepID=A0A1T4P5V3_9FIRM|nr:transcriptional repressor [Anaerorhabdus furcosa]SJZ86717.1 Fur family transcriptional regulator, peroxide stress response regulator [Anaerorhabdus furcosa]
MKEVRNTNQKEIIKQVIMNNKDHLTGDQIYEMVKEHMPSISRATVFRNLKRLVELDEIGHIEIADGADCFDYRKHDHYHFKCNECHKVFDTSIPYDNGLDTIDPEFKVDHHVTLFYGICPECLKKHNHEIV